MKDVLRLVALILACLLGSAPCGATEGRQPRLTITFWCGPPLAEFDDARAAEIAAAGFNVVGPPCEGGTSEGLNLQALDVAARHGLRMCVADQRFGAHATEQPGWKSGVAQAVAAYRRHPALRGYFIDDEPAAKEFDAVAGVVSRLKAEDPDHPAYVNLLPDYVKPANLGTDSYEEYLDRFIRAVHPALLSYDYYPFLIGHEPCGTSHASGPAENPGDGEAAPPCDRPSFFDNLAVIRTLSLEHNLSFMLIVLAMPHGPYRDPTEAELAWQVFHALAYGARGISYFAYWTPVDVAYAEEMRFRYGLIEDGKPTSHYFQAARINRMARAVAQQLAGFRSIAVADSAGEIGVPFPIGPIAAIDGGAITVGLFGNDSGDLAALLVNRDYRYGADATLSLAAGGKAPEVFGVEERSWRPATDLTFRLPPGWAVLLRWR